MTPMISFDALHASAERHAQTLAPPPVEPADNVPRALVGSDARPIPGAHA